NMEYANKFSVVTGIISADLVRAMRLHTDMEAQIKEAGLMAAADFRKVLAAHCDEAGRVIENHSLLLLKPVNMTVKESVRRCARVIRGDDVIGTDGKDRVLLLLPGTPEAGARIVVEKLRAEGIGAEQLMKADE
ncbi:MAG: GGDEF domain-containing protein, partial [Lachnospiraceae bacterium]|nr:GGDEF domain-containing protein [Lachnospiraceae bacterium]